MDPGSFRIFEGAVGKLFRACFAHMFKYTGGRIIRMKKRSLGRFTLKLFIDRPKTRHLVVHNLPLCGFGERHAQVFLDSLESVEGHPGPIMKVGHDTGHGWIVFGPLSFGRLFGSEDILTPVTTQSLTEP